MPIQCSLVTINAEKFNMQVTTIPLSSFLLKGQGNALAYGNLMTAFNMENRRMTDHSVGLCGPCPRGPLLAAYLLHPSHWIPH
jgi:hypothetical protein